MVKFQVEKLAESKNLLITETYKKKWKLTLSPEKKLLSYKIRKFEFHKKRRTLTNFYWELGTWPLALFNKIEPEMLQAQTVLL